MSTLTLSRPRQRTSEPTFATAQPGQLYRSPDGTLKRKPILSIVPTATPAQPAARPQTPRPGIPKADSLRAPLRGQKPVKRGNKVPAYLVALEFALRAQYPVFAEGLPLKIGILADLVNAGVGQATAKAFLKYYTGRAKYIRAVASGVNRFNLDGTVAGEIAEKHRAFAVEQLKGIT
jgi:hypothetical protein